MKTGIDFASCSFAFSERPPAEVLKALKAHGFRWNRIEECWIRRRGWGGLPDNFADWICSKAGDGQAPLINRYP